MNGPTNHWVQWYARDDAEAEHLIHVEAVLRRAGLCADADTVLEVGRFILSDPKAPAKLRRLADLWQVAAGERHEVVPLTAAARR